MVVGGVNVLVGEQNVLAGEQNALGVEQEGLRVQFVVEEEAQKQVEEARVVLQAW